MSKLLLDKTLTVEPSSEAKDVARIWTLTVVRRINRKHKAIVLRFLYESGLIQVSEPSVNLLK